MKKIILIFFLFFLTSTANSQTVLGQLGCDTIKEVPTTINVNDNPIIIINSPIANLRVESKNRIIIKRVEESEGRWAIIVMPGTHKLVFDAKGYERLELENYVFAKQRTYEIRIHEVRAPRTGVETVGKGSIIVKTDPEGATITIDGIPGEWKSPAVVKNIMATTYTITAFKQKYDSLVFTTTILQDSTITPSIAKLVPQFGFLKIITDRGAVLKINNKTTVFSSDSVMELTKGTYSLLLERPRYQVFSKDITIASGDTTVVEQQLIPTFAYYDFSKLTKETKVWLDGNLSRTAIIETTPGEHTISIENKSTGQLTKSFTLMPGETKIIRERDLQDPGSLIVNSDVLARLFIDDQEASLSILNESIPSGFHTIRLVNDQLGEETRTIRILPNQEKDVFITMLPSRSTAAVLTIFPGISQMYRGMTAKGLLYLGSFILSAAGSYYFYDQYNQQDQKYNNYIAEYKATTDGTRALALHNLITSTYTQVTNVQKQSQMALGITGVIFVWNILDSIIFGPRYGYRNRGDSAYNLRLDSENKHLTLGISVAF